MIEKQKFCITRLHKTILFEFLKKKSMEIEREAEERLWIFLAYFASEDYLQTTNPNFQWSFQDIIDFMQILKYREWYVDAEHF